MDLKRSYEGLGDVIIEATDEIIVDPIQGGAGTSINMNKL